MHREIQIKQFPIVTTHWWPKTRNEQFVWENEQYLYRFYLLYTTMSKWSECAHASCRDARFRLWTRAWLPALSDACTDQSARTHRMQEVNTRGTIRYKYCSFSHTNRSFRVLGHQCVVTMGNCLIWISLCMFFFPIIETVTYTCHYMTDRLERFDLKISKLDLLKKKKKRHLHLGCPWGKLIDTKF